jgi:REP element-mobilizing transposase RayT
VYIPTPRPTKEGMLDGNRRFLSNVEGDYHSLESLRLRHHYHLVLPVKYRKALLSQEVVACAIVDTLHGLEEHYDLTIEQSGDDKTHIHVLVSFHPQYGIGKIVRVIKSITARRLFTQLPELKKELWGRRVLE